MSNEIPVVTDIVDCEKVIGKTLSNKEACDLVSNNAWWSTSRNWWYQGLVITLCEIYQGFDELRYLGETIAIVSPEVIDEKISAITKLIATIRHDTEPFLKATAWYGATAQEVRNNIEEAEVLRTLDDDCMHAFANFFSFLLSQKAALEEAKLSGKCLLYIQLLP
ncbi:MAG: hypothetical protein PHH59_09535 [Methylovulum sp.]|uniref:hypothetical protein n=1 Tax=Methylovulum sp. TaxID=1916980 RepID=UPI002629EB85|nr:hypothetical protein [Methylovulum sp.]MDD2724246.1 hypothetical protein [Methylovulum sp.]MDD5123021.1 hypothetical protein [Methylovulum sp.]